MDGILKNVSVMTTCDAVSDAADRLKDLDHVCFGLHATVNAEWSRVRWGPVLGEAVPSLVRADGTFPMSVNELADGNPDPVEALEELKAQLDRGRRLGFDFRYADQHMGFGRAIPGFDELFGDWCRREGLLDFRAFNRRLPRPSEVATGDPADCLVADLASADPGQYVLVGHPAYDTEEMRQIGNEKVDGTAEAKSRDWQRRWFTDRRVLDYCEANQVRAIRYDEAEPAE